MAMQGEYVGLASTLKALCATSIPGVKRLRLGALNRERGVGKMREWRREGWGGVQWGASIVPV